jgi:hypothetical protein
MRNFRKLEIWQRSMGLVDEGWLAADSGLLAAEDDYRHPLND